MKEQIKNWIKKNPQIVFFSMVLITIVSLVSTIVSYQMEKENPSTLELIFSESDLEREERLGRSDRYLRKQKYLDELNEFKIKEVLNSKDSLRIEYLINKINQNE